MSCSMRSARSLDLWLRGVMSADRPCSGGAVNHPEDL